MLAKCDTRQRVSCLHGDGDGVDCVMVDLGRGGPERIAKAIEAGSALRGCLSNAAGAADRPCPIRGDGQPLRMRQDLSGELLVEGARGEDWAPEVVERMADGVQSLDRLAVLVVQRAELEPLPLLPERCVVALHLGQASWLDRVVHFALLQLRHVAQGTYFLEAPVQDEELGLRSAPSSEKRRETLGMADATERAACMRPRRAKVSARSVKSANTCVCQRPGCRRGVWSPLSTHCGPARQDAPAACGRCRCRRDHGPCPQGLRRAATWRCWHDSAGGRGGREEPHAGRPTPGDGRWGAIACASHAGLQPRPLDAVFVYVRPKRAKMHRASSPSRREEVNSS